MVPAGPVANDRERSPLPPAVLCPIRTLRDLCTEQAQPHPDRPLLPEIAAASFGTDHWEASPSLKAQCLRYAKAIHPVSVREQTGIDICRQELGIAAVQMPDPVFLLPAAAYLDLCAGIPRTEEPYIAAYILDDREEVDAQLARTAAESGLPIRRCTAGKDATLSVEEWLALFRDAKEVVTDSFHGSVIARLLDKKCTTLCNEQRGKTRFDELNRLGTDLEALRQKGLSFLRDALSHNNE